jgi:hypothetical protein
LSKAPKKLKGLFGPGTRVASTPTKPYVLYNKQTLI